MDVGTSPCAVVLLYHRVANDRVDAFGNRVSPENFAAQMEIIRDQFSPVPLRDLASRSGREALPERAVAVTFDDGYADNLHTARPLLERYEVPATIFVAAAALDGMREFWWDRLERLLLTSPRLQRRLEIDFGGPHYRLDLGEWSRYDPFVHPGHSRWTAYGDADPTPRHRALRELWERLRLLTPELRSDVMEHIATWAEDDGTGTVRPLMTPSEVAELAGDDLVEIGAHTVTHPSLTALPPARQWEEIDGSRAALRSLLEHDITLFAYPFGKPSDYDATTVELVKRAGFTVACSTRPGAVLRHTPELQLPRLTASNDDGRALAVNLEHCFRTPLSSSSPQGALD